MTFWGKGNPNPGWNGDPSPGDDLYCDSVVALDADTGKMKWYYQFTPHDEFDWDSVEIPVLANANWNEQPRKVMPWAKRNGFFYVLDRLTGKFLLGKAFVKQSWNVGFDESGRPIKVQDFRASFRRNLYRAGRARGNKLVFAVVQSRNWLVLHFDLGQLFCDLKESRSRSLGRDEEVYRSCSAASNNCGVERKDADWPTRAADL